MKYKSLLIRIPPDLHDALIRLRTQRHVNTNAVSRSSSSTDGYATWRLRRFAVWGSTNTQNQNQVSQVRGRSSLGNSQRG